jgi:hypothetical protein
MDKMEGGNAKPSGLRSHVMQCKTWEVNLVSNAGKRITNNTASNHWYLTSLGKMITCNELCTHWIALGHVMIYIYGFY